MRTPRRLIRIFAVLLALGGAGCALLEHLGLASSRPVFSHTNHTEEQDLSCKDCHPTYAAGDAATMPKRRLCILCHEGIDENKPPEQKIANLFGDPPPWTHVTQLSKEVIYSHRVHYEAKIECAECHHDVTKIEDCSKATDRLKVTMQACTACHARQPLVREPAPAAPAETKPGAAGGAGGAPGAAGTPAAGGAAAPHPYTPMRASRASLVANDCAVCHREIRKDAPPPNHRLNWKRLHGQASRDDGVSMANRCSLCHTEASCSSCHREEEPASHTHFWKERGHGIAVGIDRGACATCHHADACDRCHRDTAPRSHVGAWGAPRDNHCYSCHGLARGQGCGMCHRGAPGHLEAEPKPSWHNAGMNCRSCHYPVPHADNGMDCNACHR
jgi:hypothetical protein